MDEQTTSDPLCAQCSRLHIPDASVKDCGTVSELKSRKSCPVCRLLIGMCGIDAHPDSRVLIKKAGIRDHLNCNITPKVAFGILQKQNQVTQPINLEPLLATEKFIVILGSKVMGGLFYSIQDGSTQDGQSCFPLNKIPSYSERLDYPKIMSQLSECDSNHEHCRRYHLNRQKMPLTKTFFIDITQNCLVLKDTSKRYLALSYVWGRTSMFKTTSSNVETLQRPGSLVGIQPHFSRVVQDAIRVTKKLGERYLWVDALCIPQDDETQLNYMVARMDSIYAHAYLTIVAMSANSADSPLPGVRRSTRSPSISLIHRVAPPHERHSPSKYATIRLPLQYSTFYSLYASRGWTFQESNLSRRCLIFTNHETFFYCDSALSTDSGIALSRETWTERKWVSLWFTISSVDIDDVQQFLIYSQLISDFTSRRLTYPEDSIRAISGVLAIFSRVTGWQFVAGMPTHLLEPSLLWRSTSNPSQGEYLSRNTSFPSWSWAGWIGEMFFNHHELEPFSLYTEDTQSAISFRSELKLSKQQAALLAQPEGFQESQLYALQIEVSSASITAFGIRPRPLPYRYKGTRLTYFDSIWAVGGHRCGLVFDLKDDGSKKQRVIAISRSECKKERFVFHGDSDGSSNYHLYCDEEIFQFSEYCFVNVLFIEPKGDAWERVGVGLIHVDVWDAVEKSRENIVLK